MDNLVKSGCRHAGIPRDTADRQLHLLDLLDQQTPGWVAILFVGAALFRSSITVIVRIDLERVFVNRHPIGRGWSSMCPASISKHPDRPAEVCKAS